MVKKTQLKASESQKVNSSSDSYATIVKSNSKNVFCAIAPSSSKTIEDREDSDEKIVESVQFKTSKLKSMIRKQNKKVSGDNQSELLKLIIKYNGQVSGVTNKIKNTMSFVSLSESASNAMKNVIENSTLQTELHNKIYSITLKKLFVSSELTRRAIRLNDYLENSLNISLVENIQDLPKLECQLKKSFSENAMSINYHVLPSASCSSASISMTNALLSTSNSIQRKNSRGSERIKKIYETIQSETGKIKTILGKKSDNDISHEKSEGKNNQAGFDESLDLIELKLNEEITTLSVDLVFVTFEYMRIALCILQPELNHSCNETKQSSFESILKSSVSQKSLSQGFQLSTALFDKENVVTMTKSDQVVKKKTPEKENAIRFSLKRVSVNPAKRLNMNIFSVNIQNILDSKAQKTLNLEEELKCQKCPAFYSSYCEEKAKAIFHFGSTANQSAQCWDCCICGYKNSSKSRISSNNYIDDYDDIEYIKHVSPPSIVARKQVNSKVVVFCIDVSGSMAGRNIEMVKSSCLATLKLIKEKHTEFKVALVTFESKGIYWGHGSLREYTVSESDWSSTSNQNTVRNQSHSLKPVSESYDQIVSAINNLQASGGTRIISALAHSVLIASSVKNSEIILCTDGAADDMCNIKYNEIAEYCNQNGNIQINLVAFDGCDCDMNNLGSIVSKTNGIIRKTSDPIEFESSMKVFIEQSVKKDLSDSISILGDYDRVKFVENVKKAVKCGKSSNLHHVQLDNWNPAVEILLEFNVENKQTNNQDGKYVFFQVKIVKDDRVRVITKKIEISNVYDSKETICDLNLIHAYALRKFTRYIYEENDYKEATAYLNDYKQILDKYEDVDSRVLKTVDVISSLNGFNSISEQDSEFLHNNKRVNSYDLKRDVKARGISESEIKEMIHQCREIKDCFNKSCSELNEIADRMDDGDDQDRSNFKKEIMKKFEDFDQKFMQSDISEITMYAVLGLIEQMKLLIRKVQDIMNINEDDEIEYVDKNGRENEDIYFSGDEDEGDYDEKIENLKKYILTEFRKMENLFEKFNKLKPYSESWISDDESLIQMLFENIVLQCKESKQPIVELSEKMVNIIDRSESIIGN